MGDSTDVVAAYEVAVRKVNETAHRAELLAKVVSDGAAKLRDWRGVIIANASGQGGYPPQLATLRTTPSINAREWPSAEVLHEALTAWHATCKQCRLAWSQIPEDRRSGLGPPP